MAETGIEAELAGETIEQLQEFRRLANDFLWRYCSYTLRLLADNIVGYSQVLLKEVDDPISNSQRADLTHIYESGQVIRRDIDTLFDLLRIENYAAGFSKELPVRQEEVDLRQVIENIDNVTALYSCGGATHQKTVEIECDMPDNLPFVLADAQRVQIIVTDVALALVGDLETGEGKVAITIDCDDNQSIISIGNFASPFPHDVLVEFRNTVCSPTLFYAPYLSDSLRLRIAQAFVELLGGRMQLEGKEKTGAVVVLTLPLAR